MKFIPKNPPLGLTEESAKSVVSDPRFQSIMRKAGEGGLTSNQLGNASVWLMTAFPYCGSGSLMPTFLTPEAVMASSKQTDPSPNS